MSQLRHVLTTMPLSTLFFAVVCCGTYLLQMALSPSMYHYTLRPWNILYLHEYYRVLSSAFFHGSPMHLFMNVTSTTTLGAILERRLGTIRHFLTILWGVILTTSVYCLAAHLASVVVGIDGMMYQHSLGFSGVLFQLSVLEAYASGGTRSVFGFVNVSSKMYPWALLVVLQVVMPQVSFWGHLSGILVGSLQHYGILDGWALPSDDYVKHMETTWTFLRPFTQSPNFMSVPHQNNVTTERSSSRSLRNSFCVIFTSACVFAKNVWETFHVCIFGHDRRNSSSPSDVELARPDDQWGQPEEDSEMEDEKWVENVQVQRALLSSQQPGLESRNL